MAGWSLSPGSASGFPSRKLSQTIGVMVSSAGLRISPAVVSSATACTPSVGVSGGMLMGGRDGSGAGSAAICGAVCGAISGALGGGYVGWSAQVLGSSLDWEVLPAGPGQVFDHLHRLGQPAVFGALVCESPRQVRRGAEAAQREGASWASCSRSSSVGKQAAPGPDR